MKLITAAAMVLCASPVLAEPLAAGQSLTYSGLVKAEHLSANGSSRDFVYADFDIGYRAKLTDTLGIGVDVGLDALQVRDQRGDALFAAAVVEGPYGKLSVGLPRLVLPQAFEVPALGGSQALQIGMTFFSGDVLRGFNLLTTAPTQTGLRYDATFGKISISAALHQYAHEKAMAHADVNGPLRQIAVTYDGGAWSATIGTQGIDIGVVKEHQVKLALRGHHGKLSGGLMTMREDFGPQRIFETEIYGSYDVTEALRIEAQLINMVQDNHAEQFWGVDAVYSLPSGAFVQAGVARTTVVDDSLVNLGFGYKF